MIAQRSDLMRGRLRAAMTEPESTQYQKREADREFDR
jgi:hypothetical protein